jgi:hypothetical protein
MTQLGYATWTGTCMSHSVKPRLKCCDATVTPAPADVGLNPINESSVHLANTLQMGGKGLAD